MISKQYATLIPRNKYEYTKTRFPKGPLPIWRLISCLIVIGLPKFRLTITGLDLPLTSKC